MTTDAQDPDGVGTFQHWRKAFYVAGAGMKPLLNFFYLLDEFWFEAAADLAEEVTVSLHPHTGINIAGSSDLFVYEFYSLNEPAAILPLGIFEAHPAQGKRTLMMTLQIESDNKISLVVHGATWSFRAFFDAAGIPGYSSEEEDGQTT